MAARISALCAFAALACGSAPLAPAPRSRAAREAAAAAAAAPAPWTQVCSDCAATLSDCPFLGRGDGASLAACEASCDAAARCNVVNFNAGISDCIWRSCADAAKPRTAPDQGYVVAARPGRAGGVVWVDALDLTLSGQPFPSLAGAAAYTRLPPEAEALVPQWVWHWSRMSSGIAVSFESNASAIYLNYTLLDSNTSVFSNFPPIGMSGADLYRGPAGDAGGGMRWVASTFEGLEGVGADGVVLESPLFAESAGWPVGPAPAAPSLPTTYAYRLNLPSYNGVLSMQIGVPAGASLVPAAAAAAPAAGPRPVVVYGTSITQGGVTARPGQKWTSRLSLLLGGTPVVNMGVCGACGMEPAVGAFVANATIETDAALVVVDCAWNMDPAEIAARAPALVLQLRAANPRAAVLLLEPTPYMPSWALGDGQFNNTGRALELERAYQALLAQGVSQLFYARGAELYGGAGATDPTFEGTHPHDHGHALIAQALLPVVQGILGSAAPPLAGPARARRPAAAAAATAAAAAAAPLPARRSAEAQRGALTPFAAPRAAPADAVWLPATQLALRGRAFNSTPTPFNRLPASAHGVVRDPVWELSLNSPGLVVGFATDSASLYVDYTAADGFSPMVHFPVSGVSGLELFSFDEDAGKFKSVQPLQLCFGTNRFTGAVASGVLPLPGGKPRRYKLFLPLYNNPTNLSIGVDASAATFVPDEPFAHTDAPVVWYGTSIAQGGVSFKAANAFTNVIANELDTEIFNFGFSGNCMLEVSVAQFLTTIANPGAILIDCIRNENAAGINASAIPLVHYLRQQHPTTPVVLIEGTSFGRDWTVAESAADSDAKNGALRAAFAALVAAGDANLHYVNAAELWPDDLDSPCANGLHPTDEGNVRVASFFTPFLRGLLARAQ